MKILDGGLTCFSGDRVLNLRWKFKCWLFFLPIRKDQAAERSRYTKTWISKLPLKIQTGNEFFLATTTISNPADSCKHLPLRVSFIQITGGEREYRRKFTRSKTCKPQIQDEHGKKQKLKITANSLQLSSSCLCSPTQKAEESTLKIKNVT